MVAKCSPKEAVVAEVGAEEGAKSHCYHMPATAQLKPRGACGGAGGAAFTHIAHK